MAYRIHDRSTQDGHAQHLRRRFPVQCESDRLLAFPATLYGALLAVKSARPKVKRSEIVSAVRGGRERVERKLVRETYATAT